MRRVILAITVGLLTTITNVNATSRVLLKQNTLTDTNEITLSITINNQAGVQITSDSSLIPTAYKVVAPLDAAIFNMKIPAKIGSYRIRYFHGTQGCDFYVDVESGAIQGTFQTYVTPVSIDAQSVCHAYPSNGINHLTVWFFA